MALAGLADRAHGVALEGEVAGTAELAGEAGVAGGALAELDAAGALLLGDGALHGPPAAQTHSGQLHLGKGGRVSLGEGERKENN